MNEQQEPLDPGCVAGWISDEPEVIHSQWPFPSTDLRLLKTYEPKNPYFAWGSGEH